MRRGIALSCLLALGTFALAGCNLYFEEPDPDDMDQTDPPPDDDPVPTPRCDVAEPNDALDLAAHVDAATTYRAAVCPAGDRDFFTFDLPDGADLSVVATFTNRDGTGDLDMRLFDADGVVIDQSASFSDDEVLEPDPGWNLPAGSYTVEIYGFNNQIENNYDLRVDVVVP